MTKTRKIVEAFSNFSQIYHFHEAQIECIAFLSLLSIALVVDIWRFTVHIPSIRVLNIISTIFYHIESSSTHPCFY